MSCVALEYYPTDEYKSDSDFWFFREQNAKPFIESKRAAQMFSTEKELQILKWHDFQYYGIQGQIHNSNGGKAVDTFKSRSIG